MSQLLLILPSELIVHIFDFLIHVEHSSVRQLLNLESICNKISQHEDIRSYFDNYWKLLLLQGISNENDMKEFEQLDKSLREKTYRRVFCILSAVRMANKYQNPYRNTSSEHEECKAVLFGCEGVGKSTLTVQFVYGYFISDYDPTIEDNYRKMVEKDGKKVILDILDTAAPDEYSNYMTRVLSIRQTDVIVHVVSKDNTREGDVENYLEQAIRIKEDLQTPMIFAVNKIDLGDDFPMEYIHNAVKKSGATNCSICKTSAKTGEGVTELFDEVIRKARIGSINTMECIKNILAMDKDILKQYPIPHKKKKCLVM